MLTLLRVDHRLLHGQVAFSWTQYLQTDCILIANDQVPFDDLHKTAMKLAKPAGNKLVIKTVDDAITAIKSGVTDKYRLFVVVGSIADAYRLANALPEIFTCINLGGIKASENTRSISKAVHLTEQDIKQLRELMARGVEIEIRQVPNDRKQYLQECL